MYDIPHFSNLALIGYSKAQIHRNQGYFTLDQGYPGRWRTTISVQSETSNSLSFAGGAKTLWLCNHRLKLTINGSSVGCMFYDEQSFYDNSSFQLIATTAGNDIFQGCSITKTITVLIFGKDNPHLNTNFYQFEIGEMVDTIIGSATYYADRPDPMGGSVCYPIDGGYSGGTAIGNKDGKASGLVFINNQGNIRLSGIAGRPGLYAVSLHMQTNGPIAGGIEYPFWGDSVDDLIIISIKQRWHRGDLALIIPAQSTGYKDRNRIKIIHCPFSGNPFTYPQPMQAEFVYNSDSDCFQGNANVSQTYYTQHFEYRFIPDRTNAESATAGNWRFQARYWYDNEQGYTQYATAQSRGLCDEKPPKTGWNNSKAFVLTGGDIKYVDNYGYFSYAGYKKVTIDNIEYKVNFYEQQTTYTPQYGWTDRANEYTNGNGYFIYQNPITNNWNITQGVVFSQNDGTIAEVQQIDTVAIPVCPPKQGDLILPISGVCHSLNKKPQDSDFCIDINGVNFGLWNNYHIHRLLKPESTSGTISCQGNFKQTHESSYFQVLGTKPPNIKMDSVANVLRLAQYQHREDRAVITQSHGVFEEYTNTKKISAQLDEQLNLRHKLIDDNGELCEILNYKTVDNPVIQSEGDNEKENYHTSSYYKQQTYTVYRPKQAAVDDTDYNYQWEITNASFRLYSHADNISPDNTNGWVEQTREVAGSYSRQNGLNITTDSFTRIAHYPDGTTQTEHGTSQAFANYGWSVDDSGSVTVSGGWFGVYDTATGYKQATANISGRDQDGVWAHNTVQGEVSATAAQFQKQWDYDYSAQRAADHPGITWAFKQTFEQFRDTETFGEWVTTSTTPTEGGLTISGKVWFGSGRESHNGKDHCAAVFNGGGCAYASGTAHIVYTERDICRANYQWREGVDSNSTRSYDWNISPYESTSTYQEQSTSWTVNLSGGTGAGVVTFLPGGTANLSGEYSNETKSVSGSYVMYYSRASLGQVQSNASVSGSYSMMKSKATGCKEEITAGANNGEYETKRSQARDYLSNVQRDIPTHEYQVTSWEIAGSFTEQTDKVQFKASGSIHA